MKKGNKMIQCLNDLVNSKEFASWQEANSNDLFFSAPERAERIYEAAEYGADGSTHEEIIQDMRECLASLELSEKVDAAISQELDDVYDWHLNNGSLDAEIG